MRELEPTIPEHALLLGSWFHELCETFYLGWPDGFDAAHDRHEQQIREFRRLPATAKGLLGSEFPERVWNLFVRYKFWADHTKYHLDIDEILGVEMHLTYAQVTGIIDLLYRTKDGKVILRDFKTSKNKPPTEHVLLMNLQPLLYGLLLEKATGIVPDYVEWFYVKTDPPTGPKFKQDGHLYADSKIGIADTYTWLAAWEERGLDLRKLPTQLIRDDDFYALRRHPYRPATARTLAAEFVTSVKELQSAPPPVRTPAKQCGWCEFRQICLGELEGHDVSPLLVNFRRRRSAA